MISNTAVFSINLCCKFTKMGFLASSYASAVSIASLVVAADVLGVCVRLSAVSIVSLAMAADMLGVCVLVDEMKGQGSIVESAAVHTSKHGLGDINNLICDIIATRNSHHAETLQKFLRGV